MAKNHAEEAERLGYKSTFHQYCDVTGIAYRNGQNILTTLAKSAPIFQKFFQHKAERIGSSRLQLYDLHFPLNAIPDDIPLSEAITNIDRTFQAFSPEFAEEIKAILREQHLETGDLSSLPFTYNVSPDCRPYVYLHYTRSLDDYIYLAHELGHATHFGLSRSNWPVLSEADNLLSESASIFAELMALDDLERNVQPHLRKGILETKIYNSYIHLVNNALITTEFEIQAHRAIHQGTSEPEISQIYADLLVKYSGSGNCEPEIGRYGWVNSDIFSEEPFYEFSYGFGMLTALALYEKYHTEGEKCVPQLMELWKAGRSDDTYELLKKAGINLQSKKTLERGLGIIKRWIDQFEALE